MQTTTKMPTTAVTASRCCVAVENEKRTAVCDVGLDRNKSLGVDYTHVANADATATNRRARCEDFKRNCENLASTVSCGGNLMAHLKAGAFDWLTQVNESHGCSNQIRNDARRLLVGRFVRSVEEKQDGSDWTVEALVRSKSAEQTWFQVRVTFAVSHGTTSVLQHVCSCKK